MSLILAGTGGLLFAAETGPDQSSSGNNPAARNSRAVSSEDVLVRVNGEPITEGDLQFLMISRKVPQELRPSVRKRFLEKLIDRRLMREYLAQRKTEPAPLALDAQVERIDELIRKQGEDPRDVLSQLGYTEETLRRELALPLAWETHFRRIVTNDRLREYFRKHRRQFDGTEVRARQILIKVAPASSGETGNQTVGQSDSRTIGQSDREKPSKAPVSVEDAKTKLRTIRQKILDGDLSFPEAAHKYSQAPSAEQGGDVGFFSYRGPMPEAFTRPVFELEVGDVSEPFVTPFGVHLVQVTDEKPGLLSLEDARPQVLEQLSEELWNETVRELRSKAKIEWNVVTDTPSP